ncbi:MAG TPA: ATP-binding protein [Bdellovibrionota bacterium]|nr:ATP-binding protein [Bdellovibrionota bacterium]
MSPARAADGLGLFISLNLVQNMGGYVVVRSEVGKGTRFVFLFPIPAGTTQNLRGGLSLVV